MAKRAAQIIYVKSMNQQLFKAKQDKNETRFKELNEMCDFQTLRSEAQVMSKFRKLNENLVRYVKGWNKRFGELFTQLKKGEDY